MWSAAINYPKPVVTRGAGTMDIMATRGFWRLVVLVSVLILGGMVYDAVDRVLAPWEPLFWPWGGYAVMAFLCWMAFRLGCRFDEWLHDLEARGGGRARRG
jgi:hypothetical protein